MEGAEGGVLLEGVLQFVEGDKEVELMSCVGKSSSSSSGGGGGGSSTWSHISHA